MQKWFEFLSHFLCVRNIDRKYQQILMCCVFILNGITFDICLRAIVIFYVEYKCCTVCAYMNDVCTVYIMTWGCRFSKSAWRQWDELQIKHINNQKKTSIAVCTCDVYMYVHRAHISHHKLINISSIWYSCLYIFGGFGTVAASTQHTFDIYDIVHNILMVFDQIHLNIMC